MRRDHSSLPRAHLHFDEAARVETRPELAKHLGSGIRTKSEKCSSSSGWAKTHLGSEAERPAKAAHTHVQVTLPEPRVLRTGHR